MAPIWLIIFHHRAQDQAQPRNVSSCSLFSSASCSLVIVSFWKQHWSSLVCTTCSCCWISRADNLSICFHKWEIWASIFSKRWPRSSRRDSCSPRVVSTAPTLAKAYAEEVNIKTFEDTRATSLCCSLTTSKLLTSKSHPSRRTPRQLLCRRTTPINTSCVTTGTAVTKSPLKASPRAHRVSLCAIDSNIPRYGRNGKIRIPVFPLSLVLLTKAVGTDKT